MLTMFDYDFMRNAFAAATIVAMLSRRGRLFPGAARPDFRRPCAGACRLYRRDRRGADRHFAALGPGPDDLAAGVGMGLLGERLAQRDVAIGIVLALALGFGLLFLHFYHGLCDAGDVAACSAMCSPSIVSTVWTLLGARDRSACALAVISRPLLFASLQPELAEAKGVSLRLYSVAVSGHRRAGDRRMRADRRRAAGLRADGRAGGGRAQRLTTRSPWVSRLGRLLALLEAWLGIARLLPAGFYYVDGRRWFLDHGAERAGHVVFLKLVIGPKGSVQAGCGVMRICGQTRPPAHV